MMNLYKVVYVVDGVEKEGYTMAPSKPKAISQLRYRTVGRKHWRINIIEATEVER